ncbi:hypothetical protein HNY73_009170 [Argiope bruennichi]|uniref:Uncharacterized protein n=1 Tax=Argiope bruennichi TaxID=94029 RepID=A0A8T0FDV1_ARGBR|nr:hypothetical protein HNY73_009170 [Argiope bruennichi]
MFAKVAILLVAVAAAQASVLYGGHAALVNTGVSTSARSQDVSIRKYPFQLWNPRRTGAGNPPRMSRMNATNKGGPKNIADIDGRARGGPD